MAMTGVKLDSEVVPFINCMNIDKGHKYAIFTIENRKFIKLCHCEEQNPKAKTTTKEEDKMAFQRMCEHLREKEIESAYILYDFCFMSDKLGGRKVEQLVFVNFCLDDAPGQKRMLHAGSKKALTDAAKVVQLDLQVTEWSELDYDELSKIVESKKRN